MEDRNTQDGGSEDYPGTGLRNRSSLQTLRDYLPLLVFVALIAIGIYLGEKGFESMYGAAATVVILLLWVY